MHQNYRIKIVMLGCLHIQLNLYRTIFVKLTKFIFHLGARLITEVNCLNCDMERTSDSTFSSYTF